MKTLMARMAARGRTVTRLLTAMTVALLGLGTAVLMAGPAARPDQAAAATALAKQTTAAPGLEGSPPSDTPPEDPPPSDPPPSDPPPSDPPVTTTVTVTNTTTVTTPGPATTTTVTTPAPATTPAPTPTPTPVPTTPPVVESIGITPTPQVGRPSVLHVRASAAGRTVAGLTADFGEPHSGFGQSACAITLTGGPRPLEDFGDGGVEDFSVAHTFRTAGVHTIRVFVTVDSCGGAPPSVSTRTLTVTVQRAAATARAVTAKAAQVVVVSGCPNATLVPTPANIPLVADATLCALNGQRRAVGLGPLVRNDELLRAADQHNALMVSERFFSHQGDGEPDLAGRVAAVRYPGPGVAENIGWGAQQLGSADGMVTAWMNSQHHRENILDPANREIGIAIEPAAPLDAPDPGATYTTDFGTATPSAAESATASALGSGAGAPTPAPAKGTGAVLSALSFAPSSFRPVAAGAPVAGGNGTLIGFTATTAGKFTLTVARLNAGRRAGRRCVAARSGAHGAACVRLVRVGSLLGQTTVGVNRVPFRGIIAGRALKPGRYRLTVNVAGSKAKPLTRDFRVLKRR